MLEKWAAQHKLPYVGALRETQAYVRSVEQGLTLFDLPAPKVQTDLAQWQPILDWVQAAWRDSERPDGMAKTVVRPAATSVASDAKRPVPAGAALAAREPGVVHDAPQRAVRPSVADHFDRLFAVLFAVFRSSN